MCVYMCIYIYRYRDWRSALIGGDGSCSGGSRSGCGAGTGEGCGPGLLDGGGVARGVHRPVAGGGPRM